MAGSVHTFRSVGSSNQNDGAIITSQGTVSLGQSGLFLPSELAVAIGEGFDLPAGPAVSPARLLTAPTLLAGSAGNPTGAYRCAVTFVTAAGETRIGPEALITVVGQQINWSNIPTAPAQSGVLSRNLYRTVAGGAAGSEKLVASINDDSTTSFVDNVSDGSLGVSAPSADTSSVVGSSSIAAQVQFAQLTGNPSDDAFAIAAGTGAKISSSGGFVAATALDGGAGASPNPTFAIVNSSGIGGLLLLSVIDGGDSAGSQPIGQLNGGTHA